MRKLIFLFLSYILFQAICVSFSDNWPEMAKSEEPCPHTSTYSEQVRGKSTGEWKWIDDNPTPYLYKEGKHKGHVVWERRYIEKFNSTTYTKCSKCDKVLKEVKTYEWVTWTYCECDDCGTYWRYES